MARGRKPKPIAVRNAEGNLGKRPMAPDIKTGEVNLEPPPGFPPAATEIWNLMVGRLAPMGALDEVDRPALMAMCLAWQRGVDAGEAVRRQGYFAYGSTGQLAEHPALSIERQAFSTFLKFASEYAATPVARARVAAAQHQHREVTELDSILDAGPDVLEISDVSELEDDGDGS